MYQELNHPDYYYNKVKITQLEMSKLFGSTKRAECLEQASVETLTSVALDLSKTAS